MNVILNGAPQHLDKIASLEELVRHRCKNPAHVITEVNGTIVPKTDRANVAIKEGDRLELVSFVGGG